MLLGALGGGAWWLFTRPVAPRPAPAPPSETISPDAAQAAPELPPPPTAADDAGDAPLLAAELPVAPPPLPAGGAGMDPADVEWANGLARRITGRGPLSAADLDRVEALRRRYPGYPQLDQLLLGALMTMAAAEQAVHRFTEAETLLQRAVDAQPGAAPAWAQLASLRLSVGSWSAAEEAAQRLVALRPNDAKANYLLGYALFRLDRAREALQALRRAQALSDDPSTRALIARIEKGRADEAGFREQQIAHFTVRYDGSEHEAVGRAVLRALERHYATLVRTLDHRPDAPIPVILFTQDRYFTASGAPAWSGGVYDQMDGRIRIPVGGLTASLTPDMDGTLIHEVTHAFVYSLSRGAASRVLHEGLAQYMEGQRTERRLSREQLRYLAQGRAAGVSGFYIEALAFVEFLIGQRGMGGMKTLLETMAETGSEDAAFRKVHGRSASDLESDWREQMRRRYGR